MSIRPIRMSALLIVLVSLVACMQMLKRENMQSALLSGRVGDALVIAEEQDRQQKDVLASLNKGMLRRIKGNYQASNQIFEVAKK
ncbi:MAG: hypothetical protein OEZ15_11370, partial [Gammaproteobacteria bacterium]|nr:hypothetical protein [Gammaproteobacteria bacterium]